MRIRHAAREVKSVQGTLLPFVGRSTQKDVGAFLGEERLGLRQCSAGRTS